MTFKKFKLCKNIIQACQDKGYKNATPIQKEAIDIILRGRDLLAIAKTGTGKTAAFVLPLLQNIEQNSSKQKQLTKLILAPTRELSLQLEQSVKTNINDTNKRIQQITQDLDKLDKDFQNLLQYLETYQW